MSHRTWLSDDWVHVSTKRRTTRISRCALGQVLCIQTGRQVTNKTVSLSHLHAPQGWPVSFLQKVNQTFLYAEGGGMSERRVSGHPQEKTSLCGGRAVHEPASSWGRRVGFHLRVGGEGRLLPAMSTESHGAEEASPRPCRPELTEGWFFNTLYDHSHVQIHSVLLLFTPLSLKYCHHLLFCRIFVPKIGKLGLKSCPVSWYSHWN